MLPPLPSAITEFVESASLDEKQQLLALLTENIAADEASFNTANTEVDDSSSLLNSTDSPGLSSFIEHVDKLDISPELSAGVETELHSLKLQTRASKGKKIKVKTQWLSPTDESYNYSNVINKPLPLCSYPHISKLMGLVNSHPGSSNDMDSCLVSCFTTSKACLSLHQDNESLISQESSICTVTFGASRTLEFVDINNCSRARNGSKDTPADFSFPAGHHSMNIMKPGCQSVLKHRVPAGVHVKNASNVRYSLSFRKIVAQDTEKQSNPPPPPPLPPHPPPSDRSLGRNSSCSPLTPPTQTSVPNKKGIYLLAGDSYFERLDTARLDKGKNRVFNIGKGGSKIDVVLKSIQDFVYEHPSYVVKKLFVCIGTNDIRYCTSGVRHLRPTIRDFMRTVKELLPTAEVFFQSLLPIPSNGNCHCERNVFEMNNLIYNMCSIMKLYYVDVFSAFLNRYGHQNTNLFPAWDSVKKSFDIHPNAKGKGVMAKFYIRLIHSRWFNPMGY